VLRLLLDRSHQLRLLEVGRYQAHEQSRRVLLPRWRLERLSFSVSSLQVSSFVVLVLLVALPLQLPPISSAAAAGFFFCLLAAGVFACAFGSSTSSSSSTSSLSRLVAVGAIVGSSCASSSSSSISSSTSSSSFLLDFLDFALNGDFRGRDEAEDTTPFLAKNSASSRLENALWSGIFAPTI